MYLLGGLIKWDIDLKPNSLIAISKHKCFLVFLFQWHSPLSGCLMLDTAQECRSHLWHEDKYSK